MQNEKEFLDKYNKNKYEKPSVAVDLLVFTIEDNELKVVMIERSDMPYQGYLALPGVFVKIDETLDEAASRGIYQETGLDNIYMEQLYTWGDVKRDPRMRIISVSYIAIVSREKLHIVAGEHVSKVELCNMKKIEDEEIAFDHKQMILYARERIKNKVEYSQIAFEFVPEEFTLPQLQKVYEILIGKELYKANFRKKIKELVEETDKETEGNAYRPSKYYKKKMHNEGVH